MSGVQTAVVNVGQVDSVEQIHSMMTSNDIDTDRDDAVDSRTEQTTSLRPATNQQSTPRRITKASK